MPELEHEKIDKAEARKELNLTGLGLLLPGEVRDIKLGYVLAVPNTSPLVAKLFEARGYFCGDQSRSPSYSPKSTRRMHLACVR